MHLAIASAGFARTCGINDVGCCVSNFNAKCRADTCDCVRCYLQNASARRPLGGFWPVPLLLCAPFAGFVFPLMRLRAVIGFCHRQRCGIPHLHMAQLGSNAALALIVVLLCAVWRGIGKNAPRELPRHQSCLTKINRQKINRQAFARCDNPRTRNYGCQNKKTLRQNRPRQCITRLCQFGK